MSWNATLNLRYRAAQGKTLLDFEHNGPLRVLQSLYPEGDSICHNVMVHPPGGLAGGDELDIRIHAVTGSHALITTPGATRFYKTLGESAVQRARITLEDHARLEWLPLENIAYSGCIAQNQLLLQLAPTAQMIGWDISVLGLPASDLPFERGSFTMHTELLSPVNSHSPWLERGQIKAKDTRLLNSPLGLAGHSCLATLFFIAGSAISTSGKEQFLSEARQICANHALAKTSGVTCPQAQVIVLRALSHSAELAMNLCKQVRGAWRKQAWGLADAPPRIWAM